ncbi:MAG: T9SS type A sorting domain-containing protein [Bacteroidota bacterium]
MKVRVLLVLCASLAVGVPAIAQSGLPDGVQTPTYTVEQSRVTVTEQGDAPSSLADPQDVPSINEVEAVVSHLELTSADVFRFAAATDAQGNYRAFPELVLFINETELVPSGPNAGTKAIGSNMVVRTSMDQGVVVSQYGTNEFRAAQFVQVLGDSDVTVAVSVPYMSVEGDDVIVNSTFPGGVNLNRPGLRVALRRPIPTVVDLGTAVCVEDPMATLDPSVDAYTNVIDLNDSANRHFGLRVPLDRENPQVLKAFGPLPMYASVWVFDGETYVNRPWDLRDPDEAGRYLLPIAGVPSDHPGLGAVVRTDELLDEFGDSYTEAVIIWGLAFPDDNRPGCIDQDLPSGYPTRTGRFHIVVSNPRVEIDAASVAINRRPEGEYLQMQVDHASQITSYAVTNNVTGAQAILRPWDEFAQEGDERHIGNHWKFTDGRAYEFVLPAGFVEADVVDLTLLPIGFDAYEEVAFDAAAVDVTTTVVASDAARQETAELALNVYPNPLVGQGRVQVTLSQAAEARVEVFDLLGRRVALLHEGLLAAGTNTLALDVQGLAPGTYVLRAGSGTTSAARRLVIAR